MPVRLRMDTKKFNQNHRGYWLSAKCNNGDTSKAACTGQVEATIFQMGDEFDVVTQLPVAGLNMQEMTPPIDLVGGGQKFDVTRVELGIKLAGKKGFLSFVNKSGNGDTCADPSAGEPVWVRCDADAGSLDSNSPDGICDMWVPDVTANFTLTVCVMSVSCN